MKFYAASQRYSKALWALSANAQDAAGWVENLRGFVTGLQGSEDLRRLLKSPVFSFEKKWAVVSELLDTLKVHPTVKTFVHKVLLSNRMEALPEIVEAFRARVLNAQGIAEIVVESALPLTPEEESEVSSRFERITKKKVLLVKKRVPELLAGVRVHSDGKTYDGTLRTLLNNMQKHLLKEDLGSHATA
jgi:F-type H+-transporting ATPase subunit delta